MIDLQYHSPEQALSDPLFTEKQVEVFVKRDDLIHPFISGNKWRKLKYTLRRAREENKNHLVTFGGAFSNHLLATASAAATFGFESTGFVRGEQVENDMLMLCRMFGMKLIFTDRDSYRDKELIFKDHFENDENAFFIEEGGAGAEALKGCAELIEELDQPYDHIFCAAGTGTTSAGILAGINNRQLNTCLNVIPVFKEGHFIKAEIDKYFDKNLSFELHTDYHFGGYAKTQLPLLQFINHFAASTGILVDPIYTGKMFYALFDMIRNNHFKPGSKILAVHTGGLFGLLGMSKKIWQTGF